MLLTLRRAKALEVAELVTLVQETPPHFQPSLWTMTWQRLIAAGLGQILLLEHNDHPIGGLGFVVLPNHHYSRLTAMVTFIYVQPGYRSVRATRRLLCEFKRQVRKL